MKIKNKTSILTALTLTLGVGTALAQGFGYYDSVDFSQYTVDHPSATPNLFTPAGAPLQAALNDTDAANNTTLRYRNTGPGAVCWTTTAYQDAWIYGTGGAGGIPFYQAITGLSPNYTFQLRVYGTYPNNTVTKTDATGRSRYGAAFSVDGGNTYTTVDNRTTDPNLAGINWVDNSTALGSPITNDGSIGDQRFWSVVGDATSDGSGNLDIYVKLPTTLSDGTTPDRFVLDGFALAPVPEPGTLALVGMGGAVMLMALRRRRK